MNTITRDYFKVVLVTGWLGDWAERRQKGTWMEKMKQLLYGVVSRFRGALETCKVSRGKLFYLMVWKNGWFLWPVFDANGNFVDRQER